MVRAGGMRGYSALMHSLGHDPEPLLRRVGIAESRLHDEDYLLPLQSLIDLFEDSAAHVGCPDFALRLAQIQGIEILGPVAIAIQNCPTVAEALSTISNYLFIQSPGISVVMDRHIPEEPDIGRLRYTVENQRERAPRQALEHGIAVAHRILAFLNQQYDLRYVSLSHEPAAARAVLSRYFGVPVRINQPYCALHVGLGTLEAPIPSADPALRKMASEFLDSHFANPKQTVSGRVRMLLARNLGSSDIRKNTIAQQLSMHPRTLQRRLDAENNSFNQIRDQVRREAAMRFLTGSQMPLGQVASLLGFSEQSALSRFCRQQFQRAPSQLRAQ